jgi:LL-diaminopimelate aminotransferase
MAQLNPHYAQLENQYLFAEIARRVAKHRTQFPDRIVISLGIGDVTLPLASAVTDAIEQAARDLSAAETFYGYGPYEGYLFLRQAICDYYRQQGVFRDADECFIGEGAKNDLGVLLELFAPGITVVIPEPVYPAYVDANILAGNNIRYVAGNAHNQFLPAPPDDPADLIYLCSPNTPTGAVYSTAALQEWVDYANRCDSVLLFDAAYERFVADPALPRSIYAVEGAENCAIEIGSFSKTAGFTGVRCGYTIIPKTLRRAGQNLRDLWQRRIAVKYNGTSYVTQRAAQAVYSKQGQIQTDAAIAYYRRNAALLCRALDALGILYYGGLHSPYIWMACPKNHTSWSFFDQLLSRQSVVCTPGAGFGLSGEGYCRLSAFGAHAEIREACTRLGAFYE